MEIVRVLSGLWSEAVWIAVFQSALGVKVNSLQIIKRHAKFTIKSYWFFYQIFASHERLFRLTKKSECCEKTRWIEETLIIFLRRTISNLISEIVFWWSLLFDDVLCTSYKANKKKKRLGRVLSWVLQSKTGIKRF